MPPKKSAKAPAPEVIEDVDDVNDPEFQVNQEVIQKLMASGNAEIIAAMQKGLMQMIGSSSGFIESLPAPVQARVAYLQELQAEYDDLEEKMQEEIRAIEEKYTKLSEPLLEKRRAVVTGSTEAPDNTTKEGKKAMAEAGQDLPAGIPDFWAVALRAHPDLEELINEKDAEVLAYCVDIKGDDLKNEDGEETGFNVVFSFAENPFFTNKELSVVYEIEESGQSGMEVKSVQGTSIKWKGDMDVTVKKMKKKPKPGSKAKPATKVEPVDSFFRFFFADVPDMPDEDEAAELEDEDLEALQDAVEHHMGVAEIIRERIGPHAVAWFTGEAVSELYDEEEDAEGEEDYSDEDDDEDEDEEESEDDNDDDDDGNEGGKKGPKDSKEQPQECKQQ